MACYHPAYTLVAAFTGGEGSCGCQACCCCGCCQSCHGRAFAGDQLHYFGMSNSIHTYQSMRTGLSGRVASEMLV